MIYTNGIFILKITNWTLIVGFLKKNDSIIT